MQLFMYNTKQGDAHRVSPLNLAKSSTALKVPVKELITFCKKIRVVTKAMVTQEVIKFDAGEALIYESGKIVMVSEELNWQLICRFYVVVNSANTTSSLKELKVYIDNLSMIDTLMEDETRRHVNAIELLHKEYDKSFKIFNPEALAKSCRKLGMIAKVYEDILIVSKKNVMVDLMTYDNIAIYIKDWKIVQFIIGFPEFDYCSDMHQTIRLHPCLISSSLPYSLDGVLSWDIGYYNEYAETLFDIMLGKGRDADVMERCSKVYDELLPLWTELHFTLFDRKELSKRIFKCYLK